MENNGNKVTTKYIERDIERIYKKIEKMQGNYEVLNHNSGEIVKEMAEIKTDTSWLKRFFWIVASAAIGALISSVIQLIKIL